jgi:branched-chain amino acid aminotransferase
MFPQFAFHFVALIIGFVHNLVSLDGQTIESAHARITAVSRAAIYGGGVFTTIAIFAGKPFLWEEHWRRLESNATKMSLDLSSVTEAGLAGSVERLIQANGVASGRARVTLFDESASDIWPYRSTRKTTVLITTGDLRTLPTEFRLTLSRYRVNSTSPLAGIKSCNYLERLIARDEAKRRGFDDCYQLNEKGEVTSGSSANIFWVKDGQLYTPSLETGCLPGTTRGFVIQNSDCIETVAGVDDLRTADEIFLTSSGIGVFQIARLEGRRLTRSPHPIGDLIPSRT